MKIIIFSVFVSISAAAPAPVSPVLIPKDPYWLKVYSVMPFEESWNIELLVEDFSKGLPKALVVIGDEGGRLTQPLKNFASSRIDESQQLSLGVPKGKAKRLLRGLRKLGEMRDPVINRLNAPLPLKEIREKIDLLMKEKAERASVLSQVPAAAEASEEILEHLLRVEAEAARVEASILINLTVRKK